MRTETIFLNNVSNIDTNEVISKINSLLIKDNPLQGKIFDLKGIQEVSINYSNIKIQKKIKELADEGKNLKSKGKKNIAIRHLVKLLNDIKTRK